MEGQILERLVQYGFILAGLADGRLQIVGHNGFGTSTQETEAVVDRVDKILPPLAETGFNISVAATGEYPNKNFNIL